MRHGERLGHARVRRRAHLGITIYAIYAVVRMGVGLITSASTRIDIPHHGTLAGGNWCQSLLQLLLLLPVFRSSVLEPDLNSGLVQFGGPRQFLPAVYVRIMRFCKRRFQFCQLLLCKGSPVSPSGRCGTTSRCRCVTNMRTRGAGVRL